MQTFIKNENKPARIEITEEDGNTVTVSGTPTYQVYDVDGTSIQDEANATVVNNGTATVQIKGSVDTTTDDFTTDMAFEVKFSYTIDGDDYVKIAHCRMGE